MNLYGLIDIDNFTDFNLKYGYEKGNELLVSVESALLELLKPNYSARLNSDEFVFHLNASFGDSKGQLLFLLSELSIKFGITVSIGLLEVEKTLDFDKIINHLMKNMLFAKMSGKNMIYLG